MCQINETRAIWRWDITNVVWPVLVQSLLYFFFDFWNSENGKTFKIVWSSHHVRWTITSGNFVFWNVSRLENCQLLYTPLELFTAFLLTTRFLLQDEKFGNKILKTHTDDKTSRGLKLMDLWRELRRMESNGLGLLLATKEESSADIDNFGSLKISKRLRIYSLKTHDEEDCCGVQAVVFLES